MILFRQKAPRFLKFLIRANIEEHSIAHMGIRPCHIMPDRS